MYMYIYIYIGFILYTFIRQSLSDECIKHETQGHRHHPVIYVCMYIIRDKPSLCIVIALGRETTYETA